MVDELMRRGFDTKERVMFRDISGKLVIVVFTLVAVMVSATNAQTVWYVDDSSTSGLNDGSDWANAFVELQAALAVATAGDEIRVGQGVYTPDFDVNSNGHSGDREASFQLISGVKLCGGYAGFGTSDPDLHNVDEFRTILSGDLTGDDEPGFANREDNSRYVVVANSVNSNGLLDGFTITGGGERWRCGGGMYNINSSMRVSNCTFIDNIACDGGGMLNDNSSPTLHNCSFVRNEAYMEGEGGGGMCSRNGSSPTLYACRFIENYSSSYGGAIGISDGNLVLVSCGFDRNFAESGGGAIYCPRTNVVITNCGFAKNVGRYLGGGLYAHNSSNVYQIDLSNCTFYDNSTVGFGGGLYTYTTTLAVNNCVFWDNSDEDGSGESSQISAVVSPISVNHSCVKGLDIHVGNHNIGDNPLLSGDGMHLRSGSPCINQGNPVGDYTGQSDIDGELRVISGRIDMGADEHLDSDGDGLPDWWEEKFFGSPAGAIPDANPDFDDKDNLGEYIAGTNPIVAPAVYYVSTTGDDSWDGLAQAWDGTHGPKATIQAGIDMCDRREGDTVIVLPGIHTGDGNRDVDYNGKAITVQSSDPENPGVVAQTVIDCEGSESNQCRGFYFQNDEGPESVLSGVTIRNACARDGGGIRCEGSSPTVSHCVIRDSKAEYYTPFAGVRLSDGGGLYVINGNPVLQSCTFIGNHAADGGGMYNWRSSPELTDCVFTGNTAESGGGIYNVEGNPRLINCTVRGNLSSNDGGGMYSGWSEPSLFNCTFSGNRASGCGGGIYVDTCYSTMVNCIFWGNIDCNGFIQPSQISINCGLHGSSIAYCCIQGLNTLSGNGNIGENPLFVDSNGLDGIPGTEDDDLRLWVGSPCINGGDNSAVPVGVSTDLDGLPRVHACIVDMGAYECQENRYYGDADENCVVDLADYLDFSFCLDRFGVERNPILDACIEVFDADGDKDVDLADFAEFQRVFAGG